MKNALILKGCIGKVLDGYVTLASSQTKGFIDYKTCANNIFKNIIKPNKNLDVFIQTYSIALQDELLKIYKPNAAAFTDDSLLEQEFLALHNTVPTATLSQIAVCKSWEVTVNLVEDYCNTQNTVYDKILVYRPDVLIKRVLNLDDYPVDDNTIFNNNWCGKGDFHFVMNYHNFLKFKDIYKTISPVFLPRPHDMHREYIRDYLKLQLRPDDIRAGWQVFCHQEVYRKVPKANLKEFLK